MYGQGYFRDPYNDWDVLWKFGLSWWADVIPMLDKGHLLVPDKTRRLLELLSEREPTFEGTIAGLPPDNQRYFREKSVELKRFLNQAVELGEAVECSL